MIYRTNAKNDVAIPVDEGFLGIFLLIGPRRAEGDDPLRSGQEKAFARPPGIGIGPGHWQKCCLGIETEFSTAAGDSGAAAVERQQLPVAPWDERSQKCIRDGSGIEKQ